MTTLEDIVKNQWKKIEMLYNDIKQAERKINENDKRINELEVLVHVLMEKQNKNIIKNYESSNIKTILPDE